MRRRKFLRLLGIGSGAAGVAPFVPWAKVLMPVQPVRKLKCIWSEEADQQLQALYNMKADEALLAAMTTDIQKEIDNRFLNTVKAII